uniref:Uncharacterized protein n=1 Tax=Romanomermis culicivorax TaxID=13658 RepID=A0A915IPD2_ROMCU
MNSLNWFVTVFLKPCFPRTKVFRKGKDMSRMFIHNGALHVIPRLMKSKKENEIASIDVPEHVKSAYDGASIVFNNPHLTVADSSLQLCIERKVGDLVDNLADKCFHHAHCHLPARAAFVLMKNSKLISSAVQAFYLRLPADMQQCSMKAAGLEILARRGEKLVVNDQDANDCTKINRSSNWIRFKDQLLSRGYFKDEAEGSAKHNELLLAAESFYLENFGKSSQNDPGCIVLSLLKNFDPTFINAAKYDSQTLLPADDDSWLNVTPAMLDEILEKKSEDLTNEMSKEFGANDDIRKKVKSFMKNQSSYKGASSQSKFRAANNAMLHMPMPESSTESSDMDSYGSDESDNEEIDPDELEEMKRFGDMMKNYMRQMDAELDKTTVGKTFLRKKQKTDNKDSESSKNSALSPGANSIDMEDDDFQPVDVDKNLVHGMLASYKHEKGLPGPASTLLHGLNILPSKINAAKLDSDDDSGPDSDRFYS